MATMARHLLMVAHSSPVPFMDRSSSGEHIKLNHTRMTSPFSFLSSQKAGLTCSRSASFRVCTMIGINKYTVSDRTPPNMGHRKMQMHAGTDDPSDASSCTSLTSLPDESLSEAATSASDSDSLSESSSSEGSQPVQIQLDMPRRRQQLSFTCNVCQTRTTRMVNPEAMARGTVFAQCAGCEKFHQIVDNLGLIVEYDFRKEAELERQFEASPDSQD